MKIERGHQYIAKYSYITCSKVKVTEEVVVRMVVTEHPEDDNEGIVQDLRTGEYYLFEYVSQGDTYSEVRGIFPGSSLEEEVCYTLHSV